MKSKKLVALLLTVVFALGVLPMGALAAQRNVVAGSKASITVDKAVENDVFAAYKVIDITYNAANNTLSYAWNAAFANYFNGTTVEEFAALADDSDELKNLIAGLPAYIAANSIAPAKTATATAAGADYAATFADLDMGEYFIRPTSSTSVYQLMLQKVEPTVVGGKYVIDDVTFVAKHKEVSVTKTADKTSVTKNETVNYTISAEIPTYMANATDKSFSVADLLPDGLTINPASIKVQIDGVDVDPTAYTLDTTATSNYTFKVSVASGDYTDKWAVNGGKTLVITYTATLNNDDTTEVNVKETNTAKFDFSFYPFVENSHKEKTATYDVTTFAIKIDKYAYNVLNAGDKSTKLANAEFSLYRETVGGEAADTTSLPGVNGSFKLLEEGVTTDEHGVAVFSKYEANADKGRYKYYLVETKAPSGYNLLTEAVEVSFTTTDVETTGGVYTVEVPNKSGVQLPATGGIGTVIFTVIGIAIMAGAVVLLVIYRKKAKAKEN